MLLVDVVVTSASLSRRERSGFRDDVGESSSETYFCESNAHRTNSWLNCSTLEILFSSETKRFLGRLS